MFDNSMSPGQATVISLRMRSVVDQAWQHHMLMHRSRIVSGYVFTLATHGLCQCGGYHVTWHYHRQDVPDDHASLSVCRECGWTA
jgi:hypothetical protein